MFNCEAKLTSSEALRVRSDHAYDFARCLDGLVTTERHSATLNSGDTAPTRKSSCSEMFGSRY